MDEDEDNNNDNVDNARDISTVDVLNDQSNDHDSNLNNEHDNSNDDVIDDNDIERLNDERRGFIEAMDNGNVGDVFRALNQNSNNETENVEGNNENNESNNENENEANNEDEDESNNESNNDSTESHSNVDEEKSKSEEEERLRKEREQALFEIMHSEPELSKVSFQLLCPVCLDLLHDPFSTKPCNHVFCEPCLRRLGQTNPVQTFCPLCRTLIVYCDPHKELMRSVRERHQELYLQRKSVERDTDIYDHPLPWHPGWRHLMAGRPVAGARRPDESLVDYMVRCLYFLPYFVPPFLLVNVANALLVLALALAYEQIHSILDMYSDEEQHNTDETGNDEAEMSGDALAQHPKGVGSMHQAFYFALCLLVPAIVSMGTVALGSLLWVNDRPLEEYLQQRLRAWHVLLLLLLWTGLFALVVQKAASFSLHFFSVGPMHLFELFRLPFFILLSLSLLALLVVVLVRCL